VDPMDPGDADVSIPLTGERLVALRVVSHDRSGTWWRRAFTERATAPPAIRALLSGRRRVELTRGEADAALAWAATLLDSVDEPGTVPLIVYDPQPV
jgi:hypothetical protein